MLSLTQSLTASCHHINCVYPFNIHNGVIAAVVALARFMLNLINKLGIIAGNGFSAKFMQFIQHFRLAPYQRSSTSITANNKKVAVVISYVFIQYYGNSTKYECSNS